MQVPGLLLKKLNELLTMNNVDKCQQWTLDIRFIEETEIKKGVIQEHDGKLQLFLSSTIAEY